MTAMRYVLTAIGLSLIVSGQAKAAEYNQITDKSAFETAVIGKTVLFNNSASTSFKVSPDGTWGGTWKGKKMSGKWEWSDGAWCRTLTGKGEDCQLWEMNSSGDEFKVTRNRGKGKTFIYTLEK